MKTAVHNRALIAVFLLMLVFVPLLQSLVEARRGERPQICELFARRPTQANLRAFEKELERASVTAQAARPWMQAAQFFGLREAGEKALVGREGWLFYQPGVSFLTQRPRAGDASAREAFAAVLNLRDQLAARGIRLLLLPVPNKESVYPDRLEPYCSSATGRGLVGAETRSFFALCEQSGIEVVDLFTRFRRERQRSDKGLYLAQDSHWAPHGMQVAADAVAEHIAARGWLARGGVEYGLRPVGVQRHGDLVRMLRSPPIEAYLAPEGFRAEQIFRAADRKLYTDDPLSAVLVMGDSFLRIYEQDDPGQAGFVAHLARALGTPLSSIVNDGGASTLVRQDLCRRSSLLAGKRVVVWEFVERDLRLGAEGWPLIWFPKGNRP
jgi:hypothetical protein